MVGSQRQALVQKWFKWLDAEPSCMQLKQDGNKHPLAPR